MPQLVLPIFLSECKYINNQVGFQKRESRAYYFHGLLPVFSHDKDDQESFRISIFEFRISNLVAARGHAR